MKLVWRKLTHKPTKREMKAQIRYAESLDEALEMCEDERSALTLFNGYYAVRWQAAHRDELGEAAEKDLEAVVAKIREEALDWTFEAGTERKPKEPKQVKVEKKQSYTPEEVAALVAKAGGQLVTE